MRAKIARELRDITYSSGFNKSVYRLAKKIYKRRGLKPIRLEKKNA